jgi:WD40 repeat protein
VKRTSALVLPFLFLLVLGAAGSAQELKERALFKGHTFSVNQVALSPDGKVVATGGGDTRGGELKLWDVTSAKEIAALAGYSDSLYALAFSPDGKLLASGNGNGKAQLWDMAAHKQRATLQVSRQEAPHALAFSQDGKTLAMAGNRGVQLWDVATGKELISFKRTVKAWKMAFSRDLRTLASPNYPEIDLWDVATGKIGLILSEHRGTVRCVAFSSDDTILASASVWNTNDFHYEGQVKLWDAATGKEKATFQGQFGEILSLALSPDGKTILLADRKVLDTEIKLKLLDVPTGEVRVIYTVPPRERFPLFSFMFLADGRRFVLQSLDKMVKLWEVTPRRS